MDYTYLLIAIKAFIFISIINVWFFRFSKSTPWRGKDAGSMKDEFEAYGLSSTLMYLVGGLKVLCATGLLASIWYPELAVPSAIGMAVLMLGAIGMHLKVKDPLKKSFPAFSFLVLSLVIAGYNFL